MRVKDLLQQVRDLFRRKPEIPEPLVEWLIRSLENTQAEELSCDDVFSLIDQYAEAHMRGEDAARLMPLLKQHLDICHECCEEYDALVGVLEEETRKR
jgi:hypothetical protein